MRTRARPNARVVLDTNVVLSGIFFGGVPGRILDAWQAGHLTLVLSPAILAEYHRAGAALAVRYPSTQTALDPILALLAQAATIVNAPELPAAVSADSDDDKFLACALASRTPVIVSGDKHLLQVSGWCDIKVLKPRQMIDRYRIDQRGAGVCPWRDQHPATRAYGYANGDPVNFSDPFGLCPQWLTGKPCSGGVDVGPDSDSGQAQRPFAMYAGLIGTQRVLSVLRSSRAQAL